MALISILVAVVVVVIDGYKRDFSFFKPFFKSFRVPSEAVIKPI